VNLMDAVKVFFKKEVNVFWKDEDHFASRKDAKKIGKFFRQYLYCDWWLSCGHWLVAVALLLIGGCCIVADCWLSWSLIGGCCTVADWSLSHCCCLVAVILSLIGGCHVLVDCGCHFLLIVGCHILVDCWLSHSHWLLAVVFSLIATVDVMGMAFAVVGMVFMVVGMVFVVVGVAVTVVQLWLSRIVAFAVMEFWLLWLWNCGCCGHGIVAVAVVECCHCICWFVAWTAKGNNQLAVYGSAVSSLGPSKTATKWQQHGENKKE